MRVRHAGAGVNRPFEATAARLLRPGRLRPRKTSPSAPQHRVQPAERSRNAPTPRAMKIGHLTLELSGLPGKALVLLFQCTPRTRAFGLGRHCVELFACATQGWFQ